MPPRLYAILYLYAWIVLRLCLCALRCHEICSKQCLYAHDSVCYVVNSVYVIYDGVCYVVNSVCVIDDSVCYLVNSVCIIYDSVCYVVKNHVWKMLPEHIHFQCRPLKKNKYFAF